MDILASHFALHGIIVALAVVLFVISVVAYVRERRPQLIYVCCAFGLFVVHQVLTFLEVSYVHSENLVVIIHVIAGAILLLFFFGVVRK